MSTSIIAAGITTSGTIFAIVVSYLLARKKIEQIHVLVNKRLTDALAEIYDLKTERHETNKVVEVLKTELDKQTP